MLIGESLNLINVSSKKIEQARGGNTLATLN